ncbi:MAG: four helix bundle protein [candidate division WOR-3 bacterium]
MNNKKQIRCVEDFEVYQKAVKLFEDFLTIDLPILQKSFAGRTLATNQLRCIDSICANMEEGYERKAGKEIKNFFRMSKGSAGEAKGRYKRLNKILPQELIDKRVAVLNEIRAMLESLIIKWK